MNKQCEICFIRDDVYIENTHWHVLLSRKQTYLGRSMVILKRHCADLAELTPDEWNDLFLTIQKTEKVLRDAFDVTVFNWACFMNHAFQKQPYNPHVHWHVWPRYDHSVNIAGRIFTDEAFGHHYNDRNDVEVEKEVKREILNILQQFS